MNRFTPGPWQMKQSKKAGDQQEDCIIYTRDEGIAIHIAETFQYQNDSLNSANGISIANAHLIAAAPELLEACKTFVAWFDYISNYQNECLGKSLKEAEKNWGEMNDPSPDVNIMKQAITKAKGGE